MRVEELILELQKFSPNLEIFLEDWDEHYHPPEPLVSVEQELGSVYNRRGRDWPGPSSFVLLKAKEWEW